MILIAVALALLALAAGMFLLAKAQKEGLGRMFKFASYFIILMSVGCMICMGARCLMHCRKGSCSQNELRCCHRGMMECDGQGMGGRCPMMHKHHECCEHMDGKCSKDMGKMDDDDKNEKNDSTAKK